LSHTFSLWHGYHVCEAQQTFHNYTNPLKQRLYIQTFPEAQWGGEG